MSHLHQKMCLSCSWVTAFLTYIIRSIFTLPKPCCSVDPREWCWGTEMDVQGQE